MDCNNEFTAKFALYIVSWSLFFQFSAAKKIYAWSISSLWKVWLSVQLASAASHMLSSGAVVNSCSRLCLLHMHICTVSLGIFYKHMKLHTKIPIQC